MEELLRELTDWQGTDKGDRGRVGVVAGSVDQAGPPALVGEAALRSGSDLVKILTSEEVLPVVAGYSENLTVNRYTGDHLSDDSVSKATDLAAWSDVLAIGPGLSEPDQEAIRDIVSEVSVPLVVDADAIEPAATASFSDAVFLPDSKEVEFITQRYDSLEAFSRETGAVVVSKGATDEIYAGEEYWTSDTGVPPLTVAGTGDVLTGIVASLLGQGLDRAEAARLGAWTLGTAGERTAGTYGIGMMATDVVDRIPEAMLGEAGSYLD